MSRKTCVVRSCESGTEVQKSYFRLPIKDKRLEAFLDFIDDPSLKRLHHEELDKLRICEIHFEPMFIIRYQRCSRLSNAALPTRNRPPPLETICATEISTKPISSKVDTPQPALVKNVNPCPTLPWYTVTIASDNNAILKRFDSRSLHDMKPIAPVLDAQDSPRNSLVSVHNMKPIAFILDAQEKPRNNVSSVHDVKRILDEASAVVQEENEAVAQEIPRNSLSSLHNIEPIAPVLDTQKTPRNNLSSVHNIKPILDAQMSSIAPEENEVMAHFKFFKRAQLPKETFNHWYTDLKHLVTFCNFGELESKLLRTQIILGIHNREIQEQLLRADFSLETTISTIRAFEASQKCR